MKRGGGREGRPAQGKRAEVKGAHHQNHHNHLHEWTMRHIFCVCMQRGNRNTQKSKKKTKSDEGRRRGGEEECEEARQRSRQQQVGSFQFHITGCVVCVCVGTSSSSLFTTQGEINAYTFALVVSLFFLRLSGLHSHTISTHTSHPSNHHSSSTHNTCTGRGSQLSSHPRKR